MSLIERAKDAGFDAAQVELNTQGGHLTPEDRPLFDAAIVAALEAVNYQGAVEAFAQERQAVLNIVNLYGDETLHKALDDIGWPADYIGGQ